METARLKELERAATKGPWDCDDVYEATLTPHKWPDNRALIAALRNAAPDLIAQAERVVELEAENAALKSRYERMEKALNLVRDGLRNLPASATAVQIDEIAKAALSPEEK